MAKGKKTGGRKKGSPNKITKSFKQLVSLTVEQMQRGRKTSLLAFAKQNPKEFWQIAAKLIPSEVNATVDVKKLGKDLAEEVYE